MTRRRGITGIVLAASMLCAVSLVQAQVAEAANRDQRLQFSTDGISYSKSLRHSVLRSIEPIVPGGSIEGRVWIRNNSGDDALLSVAALPGTVDEALEQELRVRAATENWSGAQKPLGKSGSCTDLAVGMSLPAGESVRLAIDLHLDVDAPNATRRKSTDFALRFLLQDARGGEASRACADLRGVVVPGTGSNAPVGETKAAAPHGTLADTGVSNRPWLVGGAAAIGLGALLVALVRRRSGEQRKARE